MRWTDDTTTIYTNWLTILKFNITLNRDDCYGVMDNIIYRICLDIAIDSAIIDGAKRLQPDTRNGSKLCAAMVYHGTDIAWILLPCNETMSSSLQVCETSRANVIKSSTTHEHLEYKLPHDYHYRDIMWGIMGDHDLYFTMLGTDKEYDELLHDITHTISPEIPTSQYVCNKGWIFLHTMCFKLIVYAINSEDNDIGMLRGCQNIAIIESIFSDKQLVMRLVTYLQQWLSPGIDLIHTVLDMTHFDNPICNISTLQQSDFVDLRQLKIILSHVSCHSKPVRNLLCFEPPVSASDKCAPGSYQCKDKTCISDVYLCDTYNDCTSGEDELNCKICSLVEQSLCSHHCEHPICWCHPLYFQCHSGGCVSYSLVRSNLL